MSVKIEPKILDLSFAPTVLCIFLADGKEVTVPLEKFLKLRYASDKQWKNWRLIGRGIGIHREDIDEDVSAKSILSYE